MRPMNLVMWAIAGLSIVAAAGCGAKDDPNTVTTASGLKYVDLEAGEGEAAKKGDDVAVHYVGKLTNGKTFDSSDRDAPFYFKLGDGDVIKGWEEGIAGMKIGARRKLIIPPDLAYGSKGAGKNIPPNSTLVFEVELVDINDSKEHRVDVAGGLKYTDEKKGEGRMARAGRVVDVHYTGRLSDGTKFDSSHDRKKPFTFKLGEGSVIPGWDQGVQGMRVGGKRTLVIPPGLGYGARGSPPAIPPNAELHFEVELLKVR